MNAPDALRELERAAHTELERLADRGVVGREAEGSPESLRAALHALAWSLVPAPEAVAGRSPLLEAGEAAARLAVFLSGFVAGEAGAPSRVLELLFAVGEQRASEAGEVRGDSWLREEPLFAFHKVLAHLARLVVIRRSHSGELSELYRINGADLLVYLAFHAARTNSLSGDER